ncbi:MAG: molybdopterin-synthase adenylyltransferase MoeB [Vulcanimicrobiaceae bacterium]
MSATGASALRRYSRHLLIPEVGLAGQERLAAARVLCVGAGGLGSPVLAYLACAGVGRLAVMDDDVVELTNLQRQTLFETGDIGKGKAKVAAQRLRAMNPQIGIDVIPARFDETNGRELAALYDLVLDCTDNFGSRYLINDACILEGKPDVFASIFRFDAQISVFGLADGPCYRCLFPDPPPDGAVPSCAEGGVLGVLAGVAGSLQASEALKVLLQIGAPLAGRMLLYDALGPTLRTVSFARDPACELCGPNATITQLRAPARQLVRSAEVEVAAADLEDALRTSILLDVREPHETALGMLPGAVHIPATQLEARMHELNLSHSYIVACRVGQKSAWAAARLRDAGFRNVAHLEGGLLAYAVRDQQFAIF